MAFGTVSADLLESSSNRSPEPAVLFYATDDDRAGEEVERLIRTAGFEPVKVGGIEQSGRLQAGGDLHDLVVGPVEARSLIGGGSPRRRALGYDWPCPVFVVPVGPTERIASRCGVRSGRRPAGDPALEDGDVLRRPYPVAGHRAVAEAPEDRVLVCLDVAVGPEVEGFEHRIAVLFAEHRTDITLEAQPCG
jgi:hypothetical protein